MTEKLEAKEVAQINEMFDERSIDDIIADPAAKKQLIDYLRKVRLNVRDAEAKGKRPSKKVARGDFDEKVGEMTLEGVMGLSLEQLTAATPPTDEKES
tara:strand:- start:13325 stop:13618 length:294 start_codon:yes stop_codon:yes gene_type:complete